MRFKTIFIIGFFLAFNAAKAADYPDLLRGQYGYDRRDCTAIALTIERSQRLNDAGAVCTLKSITNAGHAKFMADERCTREGRIWSQKTIYELTNGTLSLMEGKNLAQFKSCAAPATSAAPPAASRSMTCTINPGQAGVATYLDSTLKRNGASVRGFDGYTFKATGKIQVNKTEVWVGQLIRADGKVAEPKSYALADEWTCR